MKRESRTALSKLNVISSIAGRIIGMICTFAGRGIFVRTLRTEYLGLGGFFGNTKFIYGDGDDDYFYGTNFVGQKITKTFEFVPFN